MEASRANVLLATTRDLRPVVHAWLERDLHGPPLEYTRAFVDLMFAFVSARLGAADDAAKLVEAARNILIPPATDVHGRLFQMFRYRIEDVLAGRSAIRPFPPEMLLVAESRDRRTVRSQAYTIQVVESGSRILDPLGLTNPYSQWTSVTSGVGELTELTREENPERLAEGIRRLLDESHSLSQQIKLEFWECLLPLTEQVGDPFTAELLFRLPGEILPILSLPPKRRQDHQPAFRVLARAYDRAAALAEGEFFPPLLQACVALMRNSWTPADRYQAVADLGWPLFRWLNTLNARDETAEFLYETRELWPKPLEYTPDRDSPIEEAREHAIRANLIRTVLATVSNGMDGLLGSLVEVEKLLLAPASGRSNLWLRTPRKVIADCAIARLLRTQGECPERIRHIFSRLAPVGNAFTTAAYYSRIHLEIADSILLAIPKMPVA